MIGPCPHSAWSLRGYSNVTFCEPPRVRGPHQDGSASGGNRSHLCRLTILGYFGPVPTQSSHRRANQKSLSAMPPAGLRVSAFFSLTPTGVCFAAPRDTMCETSHTSPRRLCTCGSRRQSRLSSKVDIRLPEKGIQTPMAQGRSTKIISMIKWIRTSRPSIKNSVSRCTGPPEAAGTGERVQRLHERRGPGRQIPPDQQGVPPHHQTLMARGRFT